MSQIFKSSGVLVGTKIINTTGDKTRRVASVNFGRTNEFGFNIEDDVFLLGDKLTEMELTANKKYSFSLVFNKVGQPIIDREGNPVLDDNGNPRSFKSNSIVAVNVEALS